MIVFASVITYNPNISQLKELIDSVINQVERILIVDNNSSNYNSVLELIEGYRMLNFHIAIKHNSKNMGVAYALNQSINYCKRNDCGWLLTLDQDTVIPNELIRNYLPYCKNNVGQICCNFINKKTPQLDITKMSPLTIPVNGYINMDYDLVYACITSGTLINVEACLNIGGYNNSLFIDFVDYDISLKFYENGFKNILLKKIAIEHNFGEANIKSFLWMKYTDYGFSPLRSFYKTKNSIYMIRKYPYFKMYFIKSILYELFCAIVNFRKNNIIESLKGLFYGFKTNC